MQVLTVLLVAMLHTLTRPSCEPLMMCWPSGITATARTSSVCPLKVWTSVPSTRYSRTSLLARPTTKCAPSGSAATQSTTLPIPMARSRAPSSVHSFAVAVRSPH